ncbi:hypothetical protein E2562_018392 [Oryza meyeriana var. granulata]|uniref:Uncharacterized protein n=1 Tax=Oryza meyeriana var. granulata TaxID=110450 RepID=A0A6G1D3X9_9ORYZ|nr:hypothetical protein E2562_018392 [Oryza meyeriana var. granulata]
MASTQEKRGDEGEAQRAGEQIARAEAHAREAAREITHDRTERARVLGEDAAGAGAPRPEHHRAGFLETVQQGAWSLVSAVGRTLGVARDAGAEAADSTQNKLGEYGDYTAEKASDTAEATKNKIGEYSGRTAEKATEAKDTSMEKAREYGEAAREKTRDAKDAAAEGGDKATDSAATTKSPEQKLEEYKESAADAACKAMEYLTVRKEEVKEQLGANKASVEATARQEVDAARQRCEQVAQRERRWKEED